MIHIYFSVYGFSGALTGRLIIIEADKESIPAGIDSFKIN
jgi:hypothetical protein